MADYGHQRCPLSRMLFLRKSFRRTQTSYRNLTQLKPGGVIAAGRATREPSLQWSRSAPVIEHGYQGGILVMCLFDPEGFVGRCLFSAFLAGVFCFPPPADAQHSARTEEHDPRYWLRARHLVGSNRWIFRQPASSGSRALWVRTMADPCSKMARAGRGKRKGAAAFTPASNG